MSYQNEQRGSLFNEDFRLYLKDSSGAVVSPMHDIPLRAADNVYNMVVEVPRWSNAKLEISLKEPMNPIKQDMKKGKLRFVANCFPHKGYIWNYGALPQTWEDPTHMDPDTQANGDCDPVDICDIGSRVHEIGSVVQVKLLGTFAMIDEGETDWKLIGIDINDPLAEKMNDIKDVEEHMPGLLAATVEWFKIYKMPDGKPPNTFAFDAEAKDAAFAKDVVNKLHVQWEGLMSGTGHEGIERSCTKYEGSTKISEAEAQAMVDAGAPKGDTMPVDEMAVHKWHHVQL